ncbi:cation diffusion facilitator CzcD-associated flavoprotein CzcO [Prauserella sediminis]|uniref:Cation diffusion facilitator CzcD-associated flavoprotein CzcO n=1 Tax=Prauserella sediminis TaxID=577680 RepID=A0A839XX01_9PSEU|nr:NAD(P)/FAD-dependent oxidoreductase [Prauserella sediminis]MBB3665608.1 cation diffusion facilitator CzcD-associated flavoprotein CzcO [Prauserella sediminis]
MADRSPEVAEDVDVVVVGAGILGIYQLYRAREAGFTVRLLEQGNGVGGTWYWNRYPGCRFDSESYTYGYLFSEELWRDWEWSEEFAGQPETERYLNHVTDRFDLRRHIRFGSKVVAAVWDEESAGWTLNTEDGHIVRARHFVSTTGVLSVPQFPDVPGREDFAGEAYHTGLWPKEPVDFRGKRVAVIGTGSSGVQIAPAIADEVATLTVYQRTPSWATPLNNKPISAERQAELKAEFASIKETLEASNVGFLHEAHDRKTFEDTPEEREAFYEKIWRSPGFAKMTTNYTDMMLDDEANAEFCAFLEKKIRSLVDDEETADKLIPRNHAYGGLRPPFVTGYFEMFNKPHVELVSLREEPITRVTETGVETAKGLREYDIIVWATGFDFGTGALRRMGVTGTDGLELTEKWADGPITWIGVMASGFPNLFFPGGPHGAAGNNPRYGGTQVDFVTELLVHARDHGKRRIEVPRHAEEAWMTMIENFRQYSRFEEHGQYYGGNTAGKAKAFLLNPGGKPKMMEAIGEAVSSGYQGFLS